MTVLASDTFTRADGTLNTGNWVDAISGGTTFTISANTVIPLGLAVGDAASMYTTGTWPNDQYAQCTVTVTSTTGTGIGIGPATRMSPTNNLYRFVLDHAAANNIELVKIVALTYTTIAQRTQAWTDGALAYLSSVGTVHQMRLGGVDVGASVSDSALAAGKPGFSYSSTATAAMADTWEAGDFAAAGFTPMPRPTGMTQAVHRAAYW